VKADPKTCVKEYVQELNRRLSEDGFPEISKDDVKSIFHQWRWTWKIPGSKLNVLSRVCCISQSFLVARIQINKYSKQNLERYAEHLFWYGTTDQSKVKFLDEVHFGAKDCAKAKMVGPLHKRPIRVNYAPIDTRLSGTLIVTPQRPTDPIHLGLREESNTQYDFAWFIVDAIECGALVDGDVLVMDNAGVHQGDDSFEIIFQTCLRLGITVRFLPAYSPEFNPCELVFATVKAIL